MNPIPINHLDEDLAIPIYNIMYYKHLCMRKSQLIVHYFNVQLLIVVVFSV